VGQNKTDLDVFILQLMSHGLLYHQPLSIITEDGKLHNMSQKDFIQILQYLHYRTTL
jgi:hypothetical protein